MIKRDTRFKPRADAGVLSAHIQYAWQQESDRVASETDQERVKEAISAHFEALIPSADMDVLVRYNCVGYYDRCSVRVYDRQAEGGKYGEVFGVDLTRKVPSVGTGGYGCLTICACEPAWGEKTPLRELDSYFAGLLAARKAYKMEYKASASFPSDYKNEFGIYPTWGEIEDKFPVLGKYLEGLRTQEAQAA